MNSVRQLRLYLDTSVVNFLFAYDAQELRAVTVDFFENYVGKGLYAVHVSDVVIREIQQTKDEAKRTRLLNVIRDYDLRILGLNEEAEQLAHRYVEEGVVPARKLDDARHIAISTVSQMDVLLSWNDKHLARSREQTAGRVVYEKNGYFYPLVLTNPMEVLHEDD